MHDEPQALHRLGAHELARAIRERHLTSEQVTRHVLARAQRLEPRLHSFARLDIEGALAQARHADRQLAEGQPLGPLHGVPCAVKDIFQQRGLPATGGVPWPDAPICETDAAMVRHLRDSGAVLMGKLQMTEGGWTQHHANVTPPLNPWSAAHTSGGSSSGAGVAVAAGLCFAALGTDTGGSVRQPAAASGVYGLKPSWGRLSTEGAFPMSPALDHVGLMARNAEDLALLLGVLDSPSHSLLPLRSPGHLRVAVAHAPDAPLLAAAVHDALADACRRLTEAGMSAHKTELPGLPALAHEWIALCAADAAHQAPAVGGVPGPALADLLRHGRALSPARLAEARAARDRFKARMNTLFDTADILLLPVTASGTPALQALHARPPQADAAAPALTFTAPFNLTGHPALSMPWGHDAVGAPVAIQWVARHGEERMLLSLAFMLEQLRRGPGAHTPWPHLEPDEATAF